MDWGLLVNSFIGMLSILNPIGNVPIFLEHVENEPPKVQRAVAMMMAIAIFLLLTAFFVFGNRILTLFGITIPAFRLAGSIIILIVGLRMLQGKSKFESHGIETAASQGNTFDQVRRKNDRFFDGDDDDWRALFKLGYRGCLFGGIPLYF